MGVFDKHENKNELVNSERRLVTYVCNKLGIPRKRYKKLMRSNPEFKQEMEKYLQIIRSGGWDDSQLDNLL